MASPCCDFLHGGNGIQFATTFEVQRRLKRIEDGRRQSRLHERGRDVNDAIEIEVVSKVNGEIMEAMARLLPELFVSATVPTTEQVQEIAASPCTTLLLARDRTQARRIVGSLTLAVFRIPTGVRAWIEDVVVDSTVRGKGIGEALCREALGIAASRSARTVELTSRSSREAANRLYQRLGFEIRETNVYRYSIRSGAAG